MSPRLTSRSLFALLATLAAPALADPTANDGAANALFDEGRRLMNAGDYAAACPKFADSVKLATGVGTMLNLAVCYEKLGRNASAWSTYRDAAALARDKGQTDREQFARDSASRLAPSLFKIVVSVAPQKGAESIAVKIDGASLPSSLWGVPTPVDPGKHAIEASAPQKKPWSSSFEVAREGTPPVSVPVLEDAPPEPAVATSPRLDNAEPRSGKGQRSAALIVGGVGVAGVVLGSVFGLLAKSAYNDSSAHCNGDHCDDQGRIDRTSAFAKADVSTVAFAIGGAGLVGGAVLWLTAAPTKEEPKSGVYLKPTVGIGCTEIALGKTW